MASLPPELLARLMPLVDNETLVTMSQTCREVEGMIRPLVQTVRLSFVREALFSSRFGAAFAACSTLECFLCDELCARELSALLSGVTRHWTQLHTLQLRHSTATPPFDLLPSLVAMPRTLRQLDITFDIVADEAALHVLGSMAQLTSLHLQLADTSDGCHDIALLSRLTQLQQLHLRAWCDDDDAARLPSSLQALTLCNCRDDWWERAIGDCTQLRSLTLLEVDDQDHVLDLAPLAQLTRLDGSHTAGNVIGITNMPPSMRRLEMLDHSSGVREGVHGGTPACYLTQSLSAGLMACTKLEVLEVYGGGFLPPLPKLHTACLMFASYAAPAEVAATLASLPSSLTSLELAPYDVEVLSCAPLASCTNLRQLCLNGEQGYHFMLDFQHLRPLTALTKLALCNGDIEAFELVHEEELLQLPLQQLYVPQRMVAYMQGLVGADCEVLV